MGRICVRDQGVVHLQHQTGVDNRAVFFPQYRRAPLDTLRRAIVLVRDGVCRRGEIAVMKPSSAQRSSDPFRFLISARCVSPDVADRSGADYPGRDGQPFFSAALKTSAALRVDGRKGKHVTVVTAQASAQRSSNPARRVQR
jgi:hypothetical protein